MKEIEKRIDEIIMQDRINIFDLHDRQSVVENIIEVIRQDFAKEIEKGIVRELLNPKDVQYETSWNSALKRANELIKTLAGLE